MSLDNNTVIQIRLHGIQPTSTNHMYYTFRRKGAYGTFKTKSQGYLAFIGQMHTMLDQMFDTYPELKNKVMLIAQGGCPSLEISTSIPKKAYITLKGKLKPNDCSNFIKATEDALFSYFAEHISADIDDKQVMKVSSAKHLSLDSEWSLFIDLYLPEIADTQRVYQVYHDFVT